MMTDIEARTLYGSLRLLLLRTLEHGEQHGLEIRRHIEAAAGEALRIEEGALYPALRRMEADGLVASRWAVSDQRRRARYYKLTAKGRRRLARERASWHEHVRAVARVVLEPGEAL
ncbi:MAG: PadR family transcriptional regulator [Longimicrobiales bacterium]